MIHDDEHHIIKIIKHVTIWQKQITNNDFGHQMYTWNNIITHMLEYAWTPSMHPLVKSAIMHRFWVQPISCAMGNNRKNTPIYSYHNAKLPKPPDPNFYLSNKSKMTKHGLIDVDFFFFIAVSESYPGSFCLNVWFT